MKNLWKKAQKLLVCTLALAFMLTMSAAAAEVPAANGNVLKDENNNSFTEGTIDLTQKGTLTITKYSYNGTTEEGDGLHTDEKPDGAVHLPNVTFEYLKVASLVRNASTQKLEYQWCVDDTGVSSTPEFPTLSGLFGTQKGAAVTSDGLRDRLEKIISGQLPGYEGKTNGRTVESLNNRKGATTLTTTGTTSAVATATNLDLGIYLITEYSATQNVAVKAEPFFAAIPMTNIGEVQIVGEGSKRPAGTLWQYNVYVYPKNVIEIPDIEKNVINKSKGGSEEKYTCVNIGDEVEFVIRATIPEHVSTMTKFTVTDTLSQGLSFVDGSVSFKTAQLNEKNKANWADLDVNVATEKSSDGSTLTWKFINGENHLNGLGNKELLIVYKAILNKDCVIGREGNPNNVSLTYNHNNMIEEGNESGGDAELTPDTPPRVYTFGLEVNKVNGKDEPLQDVEFKLYKDSVSDANEVKVAFNAAKKSYYRINADMITAGEAEATIKTVEQGKALIEGLEFGTYYLVETKTNPQYSLLEEPVEITLAPVLDDETGAYSANEKGAYFIQGKMTEGVQYYKLVAGTYVAIEDIATYEAGEADQNLGSSKIYTYNETTGEYEEAAMKFVRVKVGASEDAAESGNAVSVKIVNKMRFSVPGTGGMGTWMFTVCGAVIIVAAAGLILIRRRRSMAK